MRKNDVNSSNEIHVGKWYAPSGESQRNYCLLSGRQQVKRIIFFYFDNGAGYTRLRNVYVPAWLPPVSVRGAESRPYGCRPSSAAAEARRRSSSSDVTTLKSYSLHRPAAVVHLRKADEDIRDANEDEVGGRGGRGKLLVPCPTRPGCQERKGMEGGTDGRPAGRHSRVGPRPSAAGAPERLFADRHNDDGTSANALSISALERSWGTSAWRGTLRPGGRGGWEATRAARLLAVATLIVWRAMRPRRRWRSDLTVGRSAMSFIAMQPRSECSRWINRVIDKQWANRPHKNRHTHFLCAERIVCGYFCDAR